MINYTPYQLIQGTSGHKHSLLFLQFLQNAKHYNYKNVTSEIHNKVMNLTNQLHTNLLSNNHCIHIHHSLHHMIQNAHLPRNHWHMSSHSFHPSNQEHMLSDQFCFNFRCSACHSVTHTFTSVLVVIDCCPIWTHTFGLTTFFYTSSTPPAVDMFTDIW